VPLLQALAIAAGVVGVLAVAGFFVGAWKYASNVERSADCDRTREHQR
jgi:hypothetical protein